LEEALGLADQALDLYRASSDIRGVGKILLQKAKIYEEEGGLDRAIAVLEEIPDEIDFALDPRLFAYSRYNLLGCLTLMGEYERAEQLLPEVRDLFRAIAQPLDLIRLRWAEGLIQLGFGQRGPAEAAFHEVRQEFLERQMGYDAALVSLDLARLYAQEGCTDELKRLARELMPIFEARDVHREAIVALLMFQRACDEERLTVELVQEIAGYLRRERRGNGI
jgi:tetratricopeptide (TPR) repeat protein